MSPAFKNDIEALETRPSGISHLPTWFELYGNNGKSLAFALALDSAFLSSPATKCCKKYIYSIKFENYLSNIRE